MYAEQKMKQAQRNQWFLLLYNQNANWNPQVWQSHQEWFAANLVSYQLVAGMGEKEPLGNLYHVQFDDENDPRLLAYIQEFETDQQLSKHPDQYQMLEWSYQQWVESGAEQEFDQWLTSVS